MKEIVIKIDNEIYKRLFTMEPMCIADQIYIDMAIKHGIELPEGHGELKDMKKVKQAVNNLCVYHGINKADFIASIDINLDTIDTLVEADKK